ncbi:MAG TPA: segregation and condensation protein B, partial [Aurantimonas coralicida]|nr:segregation and condensation protein B [Aurantimonas coralicida]
MAVRKQDEDLEVLDRELDDLPVELRWREWMNRIEA